MVLAYALRRDHQAAAQVHKAAVHFLILGEPEAQATVWDEVRRNGMSLNNCKYYDLASSLCGLLYHVILREFLAKILPT